MASSLEQARAVGSPYAAGDLVHPLADKMASLSISGTASGRYQVVVMTKEEQEKLNAYSLRVIEQRDAALRGIAEADRMKAAAQQKIAEGRRQEAAADRKIAAADRKIAAADGKIAAAQQAQAESKARRTVAEQKCDAAIDGMLGILKKLPPSTQTGQATLIESIVKDLTMLKSTSDDGSHAQKIAQIKERAKVLFTKPK